MNSVDGKSVHREVGLDCMVEILTPEQPGKPGYEGTAPRHGATRSATYIRRRLVLGTPVNRYAI